MPSEPEVVEVRFALRSTHVEVDLPRAAEVIGSFDVTGLIIDGARVGAPGWIFARTVGAADDSTVMRFVPDSGVVTFDLPQTVVADALRHELDVDVVHGTHLDLGDHVVPEHGLFALGGAHHSVLVAPRGDYLFRATAAGLGHDLVAAPLGEHVVVARREAPTHAELVEDLSGGTLGAATAFGRKPGLVLWQRGDVTACLLMVKPEVVDGRLWEPDWITVDPVSLHRHDLGEWVADVRADLEPDSTDGAGLIKAFRLDGDRSVRLRSVLRRRAPDVAELLDVLGLPPEVADVFSGHSPIADLPGATTYEALSVKAAVLAEMRRPQKLGRPDGDEKPRSRWRRR